MIERPTPEVIRRWYSRIAALTFASMIAIMWCAYGPHTGLAYETAFPYVSETESVVQGFLYSDPMRVHTNTFYHLSYLLGEAIGMRGSYLPYQVIYALLWWARCMLVFVIVRKFLPDSPSLAFCAGAFTAIHSPDLAMMLLGQMNQFGFILWMLLAMYCFIRAWESRRWQGAAAIAITAAFLEYMSLWSYESQIVLVLVFPALVILAWREWRKPIPLIAWYSVPVAYLITAYLHYAKSGGQSYQESVLRKTWSAANIASDWAFQIAFSLKFWDWENSGWRTPRGYAHVLGICVALLFAAGWIAVIYLSRDREIRNPWVPSARVCWAMLAGGFAVLALSFPIYLLLSTGGAQWRTQILSGPGSAIVMAAVIGLVSCLPLPKTVRMAVLIPAGTAIVYCGSVAAISKGGVHRWDWERYRSAVLEILKIAPNVQPNTVFVLTNVPKTADPFDHNMWFDMALRLAYPGVPVAGVFYYSDGTVSPGNDLAIEDSRWRWDGNGFQRLLTTTPLEKTVAIQFDVSGTGELLRTLPPFVCNGSCTAASYRPGAPILPGPPSPIASRRFRVPWP